MNTEKSVYDMDDDEVMSMSSAPPEPAAAEPAAEVVKPDADTGLTADESTFEEADDKITPPDDGSSTDGAGKDKSTPAGAAGEGDGLDAAKPDGEGEPELDADGKPIIATPELDAEGKPVAKAPVAGKPADEVKPPVVAPVVTEATKATEFDKIMAPFKANGKEIKVDSPEDARKLMQMGANYTKKMQALQPSMQILHMLRNNDLLDAGKLSYLIDLHNKNPEAIQKLVSDSGIAPLDFDADRGKAYVPGDHRVSAEEFALHTVMEEVATSPTGAATLEIVTRQWDADSKKVLYAEPRLLRIIDDQRQSGVYDRINTEIERQKMLGELQNVPFLQAYKMVGDVLYAEPDPKLAASAAPAAAIPLATKVITPPKAANGDKAKAAGSPRVAPAANASEIDPLSMSDEDFMKLRV